MTLVLDYDVLLGPGQQVLSDLSKSTLGLKIMDCGIQPFYVLWTGDKICIQSHYTPSVLIISSVNYYHSFVGSETLGNIKQCWTDRHWNRYRQVHSYDHPNPYGGIIHLVIWFEIFAQNATRESFNYYTNGGSSEGFSDLITAHDIIPFRDATPNQVWLTYVLC